MFNLDTGTGLALFGTTEILIRTEVLKKLLGPSCDYLGNEIERSVERVSKNLGDIFANSIKILGSKIDEEGGINPRILRLVVNEGGYCEDNLSKCYFGGILASSRTKNRIDDRGIPFANVLSSMSTYQIRTHYVIYTCIKNLFDGKGYIGNLSGDRKKMSIFLPGDIYLKAMNLSNDENINLILPHTITGLLRLGLIDFCTYGTKEIIRQHYPSAETYGFYFIPSTFGIELYLWVHGLSNIPIESFLKNEIIVPKNEYVEIPDGYISTNSDSSEHLYKVMPLTRSQVEFYKEIEKKWVQRRQ